MTQDIIPNPLILHREPVRQEWIDYNGHMNVTYYMMVVEHAVDRLFDWLGIGREYLEQTNCSSFALEGHATYQREVRLGDPLEVRSLILELDAKRIRHFHAIHHAEQGFLSYTQEMLSVHVDMTSRRSAAWPESVRERLAAVASAHSTAPVPPEAGRAITLRNGRPR